MSLLLALVFGASIVVAIFVGMLLYRPRYRRTGRLFHLLLAILVLLGVILVVLAVSQGVEGALRVFLIMTGAAPTAFMISILLHNAICAIIIVLFGKEVEEPVFFLLAVFGCPAAFVVGAVGSIVLLVL